jgi:hypothetical protein
MYRTLIAMLLITAVSACAEVKPWQRNVLAQPDMQLAPDKMQSYVDDHVYFSKEAATGGKGVGGGGCGCN